MPTRPKLPRPSSTLPIEPDAEQIERYYRALLSNASEGGRIELRAFYDDKRSGTFKRYPVTLNGAGIEPVVRKAATLATEALHGKRPIVVCPIPATFSPGKAEEANLFEGLTLLV